MLILASVYSRLTAVLILAFVNHLFWAQFCHFCPELPWRPFIWMTVYATKAELPGACEERCHILHGLVPCYLAEALKILSCSTLSFIFHYNNHCTVTQGRESPSERTHRCRKEKSLILQKRWRKPEGFGVPESQHISHPPVVRGWLFSRGPAELD